MMKILIAIENHDLLSDRVAQGIKKMLESTCGSSLSISCVSTASEAIGWVKTNELPDFVIISEALEPGVAEEGKGKGLFDILSIDSGARLLAWFRLLDHRERKIKGVVFIRSFAMNHFEALPEAMITAGDLCLTMPFDTFELEAWVKGQMATARSW